MPFLAEEHIDIPKTDLLSWMFDGQTYDAEKPVIDSTDNHDVTQIDHCRYTSTQQNLNDRYHPTRQGV